jgi:hypothetical protein
MWVVGVQARFVVWWVLSSIKVSRTLGQSQLNFAHTFFGFVIADEKRAVIRVRAGPAAATLQGLGARSIIGGRVAKRRVCSS